MAYGLTIYKEVSYISSGSRNRLARSTPLLGGMPGPPRRPCGLVQVQFFGWSADRKMK
jgi:hypothetical protein